MKRLLFLVTLLAILGGLILSWFSDANTAAPATSISDNDLTGSVSKAANSSPGGTITSGPCLAEAPAL